MKTRGGSTQVSAAKTSTSTEDKIRKSLHPLQLAATDKENLVGRNIGSTLLGKGAIKDEMTDKTKSKTQKREKITLKEKACQAGQDEMIKIKTEDLTSEAGPSEAYWEVLAERRRIALEDALEENRELTERIGILEEEKRTYKEMLDETRALVEVLQEMLGEDQNDINNSLDDSAL